MNEKRTTGLHIVEANCKDPAKEAEFNQWYDEEHVPRVIRAGSYYRAVRYVNLNPELGDAKYLCVYETDFSDPNTAFAHQRERNRDWKFLPELQPILGMSFKTLAITVPRRV